jgi:hypothetical protein
MISTTYSALASSTVPAPAPHDVDVAPQLVVVALAQAALLGLARALDSAHPVLDATVRPEPPELEDAEHIAMLLFEHADRLAHLLRRYANAVHQEIDGDLDDLF